MQGRYKNSLSLDIDPIENELENEEPEMGRCVICEELLIKEDFELKHFRESGKLKIGYFCSYCEANNLNEANIVLCKERN